MEKIDDLLEMYFRGETTIAEEQVLKQYFKTGQIQAAHEMYRPLFEAFEQELSVKASSPVHNNVSKKRNVKLLLIQTISFTGIAAALLLAFWIIRPQEKNDNYAVISGDRIEDTDFAQKYAEKKLNKVNDILINSMKPMQNIDKARQSLKQINKISETRDRIQEIQNKILIK
jgi:hypothetical protein